LDNRFLDFVYIGTPRAGSTWLAGVLSEHPEVFVPHNKEVHFFNDRHLSGGPFLYPRGIELYRSFFADAPARALLGELSPYYYYDPNVASRLARHFPDVKVIAFLRNPVDMLASLYRLLRQRERRAPTFEEELQLRPHWLDLGFYHRLLLPYFDRFPAEQIYVGVYERFFADEATSLRGLLRFLGVDPAFRPALLGQRVNGSTNTAPNPVRRLRGELLNVLHQPSMLPLKQLLHRNRINLVRYAGVPKEQDHLPARSEVAPATRRRLLEEFEPDMRRLEQLLGVDLDLWRGLPRAGSSAPVVSLRAHARPAPGSTAPRKQLVAQR
jgi:hypothetical protein